MTDLKAVQEWAEEHKPTGWVAGTTGVQCQSCKVTWPCQISRLALVMEALLFRRHCDEGWVCEAHPELPWSHEGCGGAGMPCVVEGHTNMRPFDSVLAEVVND